MADDDGTTPGTTKTLTQADIDRAFAAGASREREKLTARYADYDDLKTKAAEADKNKTQLDRIEEKLAATEKRAAAAERQGLIREVADELGISVRLAGKLSGTTKAELLADGRETMDDLGITPKGKTKDASAPKGEETEGEDEGEETVAETPRQPAPAARTRPRETLRSGAPRTESAPDETNPLKLAEAIPRR